MSRFLNLPQPSEVPEALVDQFFGKTINEEERGMMGHHYGDGQNLVVADVAPPCPAGAHHQQPSAAITTMVSAPPSISTGLPSSSSQLAKGSGPFGPWLGIGQLALGLALLCFDALSNTLSQSQFCVSASLFAILCALLSFVSAGRWPDRISIWLLLPGCLCSAILWACLCAESAHHLVQSEGSQCPMAPFGWSWLEQERQEAMRPCLAPMLHSLLLCGALIGVFFSLCSLLLCCRSLRPRPSKIPPFVAAARRPFSLLVSPAGTRRPRPVQLPLFNGPMMMMNNKYQQNEERRGQEEGGDGEGEREGGGVD